MATITEISNSSDTLWDAVCVYEDGDGAAAYAMVKGLCAADRAIFAEEATAIDSKAAKAARRAADALPRPAFRAFSVRGFDYEDAILRNDEADQSWWA